ncbi:MEDS domain-containing protein [Catellatospora methionotrophica]|uniref:MEDS domain-containing protein n=1 Tax=Catellatospora methionotrophica TaxID=121620 RepID=UPI0034110299
MADAVTVDEINPGDHACLTFTDPDERLDLVADFVADGLHRGQRVICFTDALTPDELSEELAMREVASVAAIDRGQLTLYTSQDAPAADGGATAERMVALIARERHQAARRGMPGLRVSADMCWAGRPIAIDQLVAFEQQAASLFTDGRLTAICQYDRETFDSVTLAFATDAHHKTVAALAYHDTPLLRICRQHRPPGVRAAGEMDYTHLQPLQQALTEALRLDDNIHLNLVKLRFIDVTAATAIVKAAATLPAGRRMVVSCPPAVAQVLNAVGAEHVPQLVMPSQS